MTVGQKLHQSMGMLKMLSGNFHTFAMDTQDQMAKQMFTNFSKQLDQMTQDLTNRIDYVEGQEPQFKMENMSQQKADMQQNKSQEMRME
ncbi:MAG: DUF1657 domain-containing protein [Bacillota bacterium]|nr:DUF1657 domain-containing protein [Bacillota bacterium]